jgi:photosystem II stability/assembly factor-like uncharacterized protein
MTDPPEMAGVPAERLSPRAKRAVGLIAIAVLAVGAAGTVYLFPSLTSKPKTASPGNSALVTAPGDVISFDFVTPSMGWAVEVSTRSAAGPGMFGIFRTADGARHWERQLMGRGIGRGFIRFFDTEHGLVSVGNPGVGNPLALYRTTDGGDHWEPIDLPTSGVEQQQIAFSDASHGWLLESPLTSPGPVKLYATSDSGDSWQQLPDPPVDSVGMTFRSATEGWMATTSAGQPHLYASSDGGRSWHRHDLPEPPGGLSSPVAGGLLVLTSNLRLLPGAGVVATIIPNSITKLQFTSFDGGTLWKFVPPRARGVGLMGVESYEDAFHWWVIEQGILYKSSDAGQTWTLASNHLANVNYWQYTMSQILDASHASALVAIGAGTGLALTNDGGLHWTQAIVPQIA